MTLNLNETQREIEEINRANGWYDEERPYSADISLLHTEVSEMVEAFRDHGLADATGTPLAERPSAILKPEGVGSEIADVLIRLLDTAGRQGIDGKDVRGPNIGLDGGFDHFTDATTLLHVAISAMFLGSDDGPEIQVLTAQQVYGLIVETCEQYDLDLEFEVTRKLAFNRTRSYRHGGRSL